VGTLHIGLKKPPRSAPRRCAHQRPGRVRTRLEPPFTRSPQLLLRVCTVNGAESCKRIFDRCGRAHRRLPSARLAATTIFCPVGTRASSMAKRSRVQARARWCERFPSPPVGGLAIRHRCPGQSAPANRSHTRSVEGGEPHPYIVAISSTSVRISRMGPQSSPQELSWRP
jgi:hypothetical protein